MNAVQELARALNPCMFCGRELRAKYPYYKLLRKENAWRRPKSVGWIYEDCMEKAKKGFNSLLGAETE